MKNIPTAEEFFNKNYKPHFNQAEATAKVMIEFARIHVANFSEEAQETVLNCDDLQSDCQNGFYHMNEVYPLENIK